VTPVSAPAPPIVVDVDGTLVRTDMLLETGSRFVVAHPVQVPAMLAVLARQGRAALKSFLAERTRVDVSALPYNPDVVTWLREQHAEGRTLVVASAGEQRIVESIADHLGLFDVVVGTTDGVNLRSEAKRDRLRELYPTGFEYVGNHRHDLPVWEAATTAHVVGDDALVRQVSTRTSVGQVFPERRTPATAGRALLRALRPHQWVKNALVAVPLLTASRVDDPTSLWRTLLAIVVFCLTASGVYLLNDLVDLDSDRHHPTKRHRPLAAGRVGIGTGWALWPVLTLTAFVLSALLMPWEFVAALAGYLALTVTYSFWGKRRPVVDVVSLGGLYTLRIVAGAAAIEVRLSLWLLTFSMLFFLSLALLKRVSELTRLRMEGAQALGRGYVHQDLELLSSYGVATSIGAVVVFASYLNDPTTTSLYETPELLWGALPVLLAWLMRAWLWAHRGAMNEDPILFAVKDPKSLLAGALVLAAFVAGKVVG
jgi:4-hydroxybenzoate polyprenyltransferase/phosphoserine phosphatase